MMTMVTYQAVNGFGSGHDGFCSSHLSLYPFVVGTVEENGVIECIFANFSST